MGYHLILKNSAQGLEHYYVDRLEDIADITGLTSDVVIYEADAKWLPVRMDSAPVYASFLSDKLRAGLRAQKVFQRLCKKHGFIVERLSQDKESFEHYRQEDGLPVKRGDFLIRNAAQIEVEVKCLSRYSYRNSQSYFLPYAQIKRHENMGSITKSPVIFAIFERAEDNPIEDSLAMIFVSQLLSERDKRIIYDEKTKCLVLPADLLAPGFDLLLSKRT